MIRKFIFALLLGALAALFMVEHDQWTCRHAGNKFKDFFSTTYACDLSAEVESVSLFHPMLSCTDVVVSSCDTGEDKTWQWKASRLVIGFSWWHFLLYGVINMYVHIDDLVATVPSLDAFGALQQHIGLMMQPAESTFVYSLDEISINRALFSLNDAKSQINSTLNMNYTMRSIGGAYSALLSIADGTCAVKGVTIARATQGFVLMNFPSDGAISGCEINGQCSCAVPLLPEQQADCFIRGSWANGAGSCSVINGERTLVVPLALAKTSTGFRIQATMNGTAAQCAALAGFAHTDLFSGVVTGKATVDIHDGTYDVTATCVCDDCSYAGQSIGRSCLLSGGKEGDMCQGSLAITDITGTTQRCTGSWEYNLMTGCGSLQLRNSDTVPLPAAPRWLSAPGDVMLDATCDADGFVTGAYRVAAEHKYKKNKLLSTGNLKIEQGQASLEGICGDTQYNATVDLCRRYLRSFDCYDAAKKCLMSMQAAPDNAAHVTGTIEIDCVQKLLATLYEYDLQASGTLSFDAWFADTVRANVQLNKGTIRIPHIYNLITGMRAHIAYNPTEQIGTIANLTCLLHKGSIVIDHATFAHDGNKMLHWYLPLVLKNCLVTFNRTLFASISGQLTGFYCSGELPRLQGALFLDKSHIKENIFANAFQKRIAGFSQAALIDDTIACDISLETIAPLSVDTPFLKADARMAVTVSNTVNDPKITGELNVESGSLLFPYRPLAITKGVVTMTKERPDDPLIELVAQNQVRNHDITMQVTGSLLQHHLMFESTPPLTEQQIIALLLVGSEQESLNIVMPTLIMTNLASLVFGSLRSESMLERCFRRFMQPFKDIHIIPRFSDQTSRGGVRGAIDIEVNDRWRAMIQKNFNLTEDTRFELEYQISDDVQLRAIRDEHRDMGAEVEMRFKF